MAVNNMATGSEEQEAARLEELQQLDGARRALSFFCGADTWPVEEYSAEYAAGLSTAELYDLVSDALTAMIAWSYTFTVYLHNGIIPIEQLTRGLVATGALDELPGDMPDSIKRPRGRAALELDSLLAAGRRRGHLVLLGGRENAR